jgi:hypothetical protein
MKLPKLSDAEIINIYNNTYKVYQRGTLYVAYAKNIEKAVLAKCERKIAKLKHKIAKMKREHIEVSHIDFDEVYDMVDRGIRNENND